VTCITDPDMEPIPTLPTSEPRRPKFEVRPNAARQWNPDAPDEVVFTDGKKRGFGDLLEAINPLQHIPIVSTIYREVTGATIEPAARMIGGLVFGGPIGLASALVNAFVEDSSGKDIGGHVASLVRPAGSDPNAPPPPPAGPSEGTLFLASTGSTPQLVNGGSVESDGLLATWIAAGAPRGEPILSARAPEPARAMPTHLALYNPPAAQVAAPVQDTPQVVAAPGTAPAAAPIPAQGATPTAPAPSGPEFLPQTVRGRSLAEYRATANGVPLGALRTPVPTDPLAFQRGAPRTLATYRDEAPRTVPSGLEVPRPADPAAADAPQDWVSAMMAAGLDRYREAQRRRDTAPAAEQRL
jgi:hypothetical protein